MTRRVVITGLAPVTPIGIGVTKFSENLFNGVNGITKIENFDTSKLKVKIAGQVLDFDNYKEKINSIEIERMDRTTQFAVLAAILAKEDAGIDLDKEDRSRITIAVGTSLGAIHSLVDNIDRFNKSGTSDLDSYFIPMIMGNIISAQIGIYLGITGKTRGVFTACATGTDCIGDAYHDIKTGLADISIAGSSDSSITPIIIGGFQKLRVVNSRCNDTPESASKPFDKNRNGFVISEGCGIVVLEELNHALKRGANIYAEVVGYGSTTDAYNIVAPLDDGIQLARCMENAISTANISFTDIDYINAHGTSTKRNDLLEVMAIKKVFKEKASAIPISSIKSMIGHTLSASGSIECIATALAIKNQTAPPTINHNTVDEELNIDCIPNKKRCIDIDYALSNSAGFGGHNATLILKKYREMT